MVDFTLSVPEDVLERAKALAAQSAQPVEDVLVDVLRAFTAPLPRLPESEEAELQALAHLSDDALRTIAREQMNESLQAQMQVLMDKNNFGTITPQEKSTLENLVERGQRLMLRKSEAAALLAGRGYTITPEALTKRA